MTKTTNQDQDRGPGAEKVELEKRLDANTEAETKAGTTSAKDKAQGPSADHRK